MPDAASHATADDNAREVQLGRIINELADRSALGKATGGELLNSQTPEDREDVGALVELVSALNPNRSAIGELIRRGVLQPETDSRFPAMFDRYGIAGLIGQGGMGVVLRGWDDDLGRDVAIKILRPELGTDRAAVARFQAEARAAAKLRHPNIVTVHAAGERNGVHFLVMEYVDGPSLADRIREGGPLESPEASQILLQILRGLDAAHRVGIIHRDIKSSNILLDVPNGVAKIADFGLAHVTGALTRVTVPHTVFGTPEYMSPEQARGDDHLDERTDLYSVGVVLYEMLTATVPFKGDTGSGIVHRVLNEEPQDPRRVCGQADGRLSRIALRLLSKRPDDRLSPASEVIRAVSAGERVTVPGRRRRLRRYSLIGVAVALALAVCALYVVRPAVSPARPRIASVRVDEHDPRRILVQYAGATDWNPFFSLPAEGSPEELKVSAVQLAAPVEHGPPVVVAATNLPFHGANIFAFDESGVELWSLAATDGRHWPDCEQVNPWGCVQLTAGDLDGMPGDEVVALCTDLYEYPTRISIVDVTTGSFGATFWHFGDITDFQLLSGFFDGGRPAIIARGMNNKLDGFDDGLREDERQFSSWDITPVVVILDPLAMNGLGPPVCDRVDWLTPLIPYAYAYLEMPYSSGIVRVSYDSQTGARQESPIGPEFPYDEFGQITIIERVHPTVSGSGEALLLAVSGVDARGKDRARAGLYLDRNLSIVRLMPTNVGAEAKGTTVTYWEQYWHPLVQNGAYTNE